MNQYLDETMKKCDSKDQDHLELVDSLTVIQSEISKGETLERDTKHFIKTQTEQHDKIHREQVSQDTAYKCQNKVSLKQQTSVNQRTSEFNFK
jgi:hypothetical protein